MSHPVSVTTTQLYLVGHIWPETIEKCLKMTVFQQKNGLRQQVAGWIWPVRCILLIPDLEDTLSLLPPPQLLLTNYVLHGDRCASLLPNLCVIVLSPPSWALFHTPSAGIDHLSRQGKAKWGSRLQVS